AGVDPQDGGEGAQEGGGPATWAAPGEPREGALRFARPAGEGALPEAGGALAGGEQGGGRKSHRLAAVDEREEPGWHRGAGRRPSGTSIPRPPARAGREPPAERRGEAGSHRCARLRIDHPVRRERSDRSGLVRLDASRGRMAPQGRRRYERARVPRRQGPSASHRVAAELTP